MLELLLVVGVVLGLAGATVLVTMTSWQLLFGVGLVLTMVGLALGVPTGLWYHVRLHRALAPRGVLEKRWWMNPTKFHRSLTEAERPPVMRWFAWGAVGFVLAMIGCALVMAGALRSG